MTFEDVAAIGNYNETGLDLFTQGRAQRLRVLRVSSGYFSVSGRSRGSAATSIAAMRPARTASCSATRPGEHISAGILLSSERRFG